MKRTFIISFVAGLLVVAVLAATWPLPTHPRIRSLISVAADGGRQEEFVIHWPDDRIARPGEPAREAGAGVAGSVAGAVVLEDSAGNRASAELFRLRDAEGNVIGIAGRLAGTGGAIADPRRSASNWLLVIPSRGALFMAQSDVMDTTIREHVTADGPVVLAPLQSREFWVERTKVRVTASAPPGGPAPATGRVLHGTEEFAGLQGSFTESWHLEKSAPDGSTRGRIVLSTTTISTVN